MRTPIIREVLGVHSLIVYDEDNIDKTLHKIELALTAVVTSLKKHNTKCQYFFNKNEDILKSMHERDLLPNSLAIDLSIYNDECKSAYLDFTMCPSPKLKKVKACIDKLMNEKFSEYWS